MSLVRLLRFTWERLLGRLTLGSEQRRLKRYDEVLQQLATDGGPRAGASGFAAAAHDAAFQARHRDLKRLKFRLEMDQAIDQLTGSEGVRGGRES
jgi:hypothetical protein